MNPVQLIETKRFVDDRGWFAETYRRDRLATVGVAELFVQDNHSMSVAAGTLRGIHFQRPPHAQAKLVRCVRGRIWDVAVDLRKASPTYGRWVAVELSAENARQIYIPIGFGHAFLTLEANCEVIYKASDFYAPSSDGGVRWDDPTIAVAWPTPTENLRLSPKDTALPLLADFESPFPYDGRPLEPISTT
jgi:dTDP-4-dehydrorhamnose 3,5-epimerase